MTENVLLGEKHLASCSTCKTGIRTLFVNWRFGSFVQYIKREKFGRVFDSLIFC